MEEPKRGKVAHKDVCQLFELVTSLWGVKNVGPFDLRFSKIIKQIKRVIRVYAQKLEVKTQKDDDLIMKLHRTVDICVNWTFPAGYATRRQHKASNCLCIFFFFVRSWVLHVSGKRRKCEGQWTRLLPVEEQKALLGVTKDYVAAWNSYVDRVANAIQNPTPGMGGIYVLTSRAHQDTYIGMFLDERKSKVAGIVGRTLEHLEAIFHNRNVDKKYAKLCLYGAASLCPILALRDSNYRVRATEIVSILVIKPQLNSRIDCTYLEELLQIRSTREERSTLREGQWHRKSKTAQQHADLNMHINETFTHEIRLLSRRIELKISLSKKSRRQWFNKAYSTVYNEMRDSEYEGPLDIRTSYRLMLLWATSPGANSVFLGMLPVDKHVWAFVYMYARHLKSPIRRALARARIDALLIMNGLRRYKEVHVNAPERMYGEVKKRAKALVRKNQPKSWGRLMATKVKVHKAKPLSFDRSQRGHRNLAKKFDKSVVEGWDASTKADILSQGVQRVHKSLDIETPEGHVEAIGYLNKTMFGWAKGNGIGSDEIQDFCRKNKKLARKCDAIKKSCPEYQSYIRDLEPREESVCMVCDRDPKGGMWVGASYLMLAIYTNFFLDPIHYSFPDISIQEAIHRTRLVWAHALPSRFRLPKFGLDSLPYNYLNIKEKCFIGGKKSCGKCSEQHSCWREVCSAICDPLRSIKQRMSKCLQLLCEKCGFPHWAINSLSEAPRIVRDGFKKLRIRPEHVCSCKRCGKKKSPIEMVRGDVCRMFKQISPMAPVEYYKKVKKNLTRRGVRAVYVDTGGATGFRGKRRKPPAPRLSATFFTRPGCVSFSLEELEELLVASGECKYSTVGIHVMQQELGIAMGDALSSIKADMTLRDAEMSFILDTRRLGKLGFINNDEVRLNESDLFACRYADDVLLISPLFCVDCLHSPAEFTYTEPLQYSREEGGQFISFLDSTLRIAGASLLLKPNPKNIAWCLGISETKKKNRFVEYIPCVPSNVLLQQWISAHMYGVERKTKDHRTRIVSNLEVIHEILLLGHSPQRVIDAMRAIQTRALREPRDLMIKTMRPFVEMYNSGSPPTKSEWEKFFSNYYKILMTPDV